MIRAGKGDSYIISNQEKNKSFEHVLVDGGCAGIDKRIIEAITMLHKGQKGDFKFKAVSCTHYDDDHIHGDLVSPFPF